MIATNIHIQTISDDIVLVGTVNGHLLMYAMKKNVKEGTAEFNVLKQDTHFSSEPIMQMNIVPYIDKRLLLSLSYGVITIHKIDNTTFHFVCSDNETNGTSVFTIRQQKTADNSQFQVCVAIDGKKLQFRNWKNDRFVRHRGDIQLPNTFTSAPQQLRWYKSIICVGYTSGYILYDVSFLLVKPNLYLP